MSHLTAEQREQRHRERYRRVLMREMSVADALRENDEDWASFLATEYRRRQPEGAQFCGTCGARLWRPHGADWLTCRRGHHWPMPDDWRPLKPPKETRLEAYLGELKMFIWSMPRGPLTGGPK